MILIIYMKMKTESKEKKITSIQSTLSIQRWEEMDFLKILTPNYFKIYDEINELEPENQSDNQSRNMVEQQSRLEDRTEVEMSKSNIFNPVIRERTQMPKFIIVGVMKCGTGAISRFLQEHPLLYDMGETYFFIRHYARG